MERPPLESVERPPLESVERPPLESVERPPLERDPSERELGKGDVLDVRPPLESPPLERLPSERAVGRDGLDVLNIGFGLGLFDEAVRRRHTPRSHTIVEAHPDVLRHPRYEKKKSQRIARCDCCVPVMPHIAPPPPHPHPNPHPRYFVTRLFASSHIG